MDDVESIHLSGLYVFKRLQLPPALEHVDRHSEMWPLLCTVHGSCVHRLNDPPCCGRLWLWNPTTKVDAGSRCLTTEDSVSIELVNATYLTGLIRSYKK